MIDTSDPFYTPYNYTFLISKKIVIGSSASNKTKQSYYLVGLRDDSPRGYVLQIKFLVFDLYPRN